MYDSGDGKQTLNLTQNFNLHINDVFIFYQLPQKREQVHQKTLKYDPTNLIFQGKRK